MTALPTVADVAAEAEFQLMVAKDNLIWLSSLVRAVHLSHTHDRGLHADSLASLAQFLDDTGFSGVDSEIDRFRQIHKDHSAPQKPTPAKRGAGGAV
ncbi:hypothetical protein BR1R5_10740 [Pseudomonas sp. BR1R-5]|uniref:hypothetical protein n=1 Tax=unclassified Pseudomonas TaxID=196821 RepID=UPI000F7722B9|nr:MULTISPECIES: hypothetical protein [unclassified Pseudomonas]RRV49005.1 hypothetical protein EGJ09_04140 [Pseudomonas sp. p106]GLH31688.1 hypothetical protein BR1R5_10740 [Pseudomonas sp. BR1R-5]